MFLPTSPRGAFRGYGPQTPYSRRLRSEIMESAAPMQPGSGCGRGRRPGADPHDDLGSEIAELHVAIVRGPAERGEGLVGVTARLGHDNADRLVDHGPGSQRLFELLRPGG